MRHIHEYINATPLCAHLGQDHWPTDAEYAALHSARDAVAADGKGAAYDVAVAGQPDQYARVYWDAKTGAIRAEIIEYRPPAARAIVKQWNGVPEKAQMVNINKNTVIVNVAGNAQAPAGDTHHHSTTVDARQWHDRRQWHTTTHNHASPQGAAMPSRGPHYVNAQPHNDFIDHWPTPAEAEALAAAKHQADKLFSRGKRGTENRARVQVRGGNGAVATVWRDAPQSYAAWIEAPNPATQSGWMSMKGWWGVPELVAAGSHRSAGAHARIQAPAEQVHHIPEDIHLVRRQRYHHHWEEPEHIHHGAPPAAAIELEAARVHVARPDQAAIHHHEPKRGFWAKVFAGPQRREQLAPTHGEHRGALRTVESPKAAIARQAPPPGLPAPAQLRLPPESHAPRQIAHQPQLQLPAPAPRKRGLFSWR